MKPSLLLLFFLVVLAAALVIWFPFETAEQADAGQTQKPATGPVEPASEEWEDQNVDSLGPEQRTTTEGEGLCQLAARDAQGRLLFPARFLIREGSEVHWLDAPTGSLAIARHRPIREVVALADHRWSPAARLARGQSLVKGEWPLVVESAAASLELQVRNQAGFQPFQWTLQYTAQLPGQNEYSAIAGRLWSRLHRRLDGRQERIQIEDIPPGIYSLRIRSETTAPYQTSLKLEPGQHLQHELQLTAGAFITGTVVDEHGKALAGASVALLPEDLGLLQPMVEYARDFLGFPSLADLSHKGSQGETDAGGRYRLGPLPPTRGMIYAGFPGKITGAGASVAILEAGVTTEQEAISLHPGHSLQVEVLEFTSQKPLADVRVRYFPGIRNESMFGNMIPWREPEISRTDATGKIRLDGLPAGVVQVRLDGEGFAALEQSVEVQAGSDQNRVQLFLKAQHSVEGWVRRASDGQAVAAAEVLALPAEEYNLMARFTAQVGSDFKTKSNEEGYFRIDGLPAGPWRFLAKAEGLAPKGTEALNLSSGISPPPVEILLSGGAELEVLVQDSEGQPQPAAILTVFPLNGDDSRNARTAADGRFLFENLTPGSYQVSVNSFGTEPENLFSLDFDQASGISEIVNLEEGEREKLVLGGRIDYASLEGWTLRAGEPVSGITVMLSSGNNFKSSVTDADGYYQIDDIPPGPYFLLAGELKLGNGAGFTSAVELGPGEQGRLDLDLPGSTVKVTVVAEDTGEPLPGITIMMRDAQAKPGGGMLTTNSQGEVLFQFLNPGTYVIGAGRAVMPLFGGPSKHESQMISPVVVPENQDLALEYTLRLAQAASVEVQVLGTDGLPVSGAGVFYLDSEGQPLSQFTMQGTDSSGRVRLHSLPSGLGRLLARHPEMGQVEKEVRLESGEENKVELHLETGTVLRVLVVDGRGEPLKGVQVIALDQRNAPVSTLFTSVEAMAKLYEFMEGGEQRLGPLAPGDYSLMLVRPGGPSLRHKVHLAPGVREQFLQLEYQP
ncbi:MAG: hypothetical protein DWQ01_22490 [Planctomycetota bacterium]|nr:MAG: hypothetical protein DWQ01_22490 [Planctomycetota bacterium]